jgi:hypothetical protein
MIIGQCGGFCIQPAGDICERETYLQMDQYQAPVV